MPVCGACYQPLDPDDYLYFCDECGRQLTRQFEALQEFGGEVLGLEVLASRVMFGERERQQAVWRVG